MRAPIRSRVSNSITDIRLNLKLVMYVAPKF